MKETLIGLALLILVGLNAIGLTSDGTRFASVNDFKTRQATIITDPATANQMKKRVQDTHNLCNKGYPGPGGKDDCIATKKLLADPRYIKM